MPTTINFYLKDKQTLISFALLVSKMTAQWLATDGYFAMFFLCNEQRIIYFIFFGE